MTAEQEPQPEDQDEPEDTRKDQPDSVEKTGELLRKLLKVPKDEVVIKRHRKRGG
jgi:hypothetical protein